MSDVDVWINAAELADTFEHMRTWLDHNDCIPANFDVRTGEPDTVLVVHVEFSPLLSRRAVTATSQKAEVGVK